MHITPRWTSETLSIYSCSACLISPFVGGWSNTTSPTGSPAFVSTAGTSLSPSPSRVVEAGPPTRPSSTRLVFSMPFTRSCSLVSERCCTTRRWAAVASEVGFCADWSACESPFEAPPSELRFSYATLIPLPNGGMKLLPLESTREPSSAWTLALDKTGLPRLTR